MRSLDILKSEARLRGEAILRDACVNRRYLMVHTVLAQAFASDLDGVSTAGLPDYLSKALSKQAERDPFADENWEDLAA